MNIFNWFTASHTVVTEEDVSEKEKRDANFNARVVRHINIQNEWKGGQDGR